MCVYVCVPVGVCVCVCWGIGYVGPNISTYIYYVDHYVNLSRGTPE